eukprot:gene5673-6552_t
MLYFEIENSNNVIKGLVSSKLGADRKPVYSYGNLPATYDDNIIIHNSTTFKSWFNDVQDVTQSIPLTLVLTNNKTSDDPRIFSYDNGAFFPIDGRGWDRPGVDTKHTAYYDANGTPHNFHFCLELHARFTYKGGEQFKFRGDDDVWVFINNRLVVDLGAPHDATGENGYGFVNLDTLELDRGEDYPFDFFYCERHSTESHIMISTSLELKCGWTDYCGVCEGDGTSCCTPALCNDANPCTVDKCPPPTTLRTPGQTIRDICIHTAIACNKSSCGDYACNPLSGKCEMVTEVQCPYRDSCSIGTCNEKFGGCVYDKIGSHLCLENPPQRGGFNVSGPGDSSCYKPFPPCGNMAPGKPVMTLPAGQPFQIKFQQNYNHYYAPNPGFMDAAISYNGDNGTFKPVGDIIADYYALDMVSQTNFYFNIIVPTQTCTNCVLRVRYVSNNAGEGKYPDFVQCSDISIQ